jgi:hypothetical protein
MPNLFYRKTLPAPLVQSISSVRLVSSGLRARPSRVDPTFTLNGVTAEGEVVVSSLTFLALWSAALGADNSDNYAEAHRQAMQTGQPIVVMVSTEWCAPCQVMKKTVIPQVRQRGLLRRVLFAVVNPDRDHELATQLTGGGPVPQLVMYRKTPDGWMRRKLIGGQSVESVETFINQGIAEDEALAKGAGGKPQEAASKAPAKAVPPPASVKKDQTAPSQPDKAGDQTPVVPVSHSGNGK